MRPSTCVGFCLVLVSVSFLILIISSVFLDDEAEPDNISGDENFRELIPANDSFIWFQGGKGEPKLDQSWNELKDFVEGNLTDIHLKRFDCTVFRPICQDLGIERFPFLAWVHNGSIVQQYEGNHDFESLKTFVFGILQAIKYEASIESPAIEADHQQVTKTTVRANDISHYRSTESSPIAQKPSLMSSSVESILQKAVPTDNSISEEETTNQIVDELQQNSTITEAKSLLQVRSYFPVNQSVVEVSAENFTESLNSEGVTLLLMYASWCKYCKQIKIPLNEIAAKYSGDPTIKVVQLDCMKASNKQRCAQEHVKGFPTVNIYKNGRLVFKDYTGFSFAGLEDIILSHLKDDVVGFKAREAERRRLERQAKKKAKQTAAN